MAGRDLALRGRRPAAQGHGPAVLSARRRRTLQAVAPVRRDRGARGADHARAGAKRQRRQLRAVGLPQLHRPRPRYRDRSDRRGVPRGRERPARARLRAAAAARRRVAGQLPRPLHRPAGRGGAAGGEGRAAVPGPRPRAHGDAGPGAGAGRGGGARRARGAPVVQLPADRRGAARERAGRVVPLPLRPAVGWARGRHAAAGLRARAAAGRLRAGAAGRGPAFAPQLPRRAADRGAVAGVAARDRHDARAAGGDGRPGGGARRAAGRGRRVGCRRCSGRRRQRPPGAAAGRGADRRGAGRGPGQRPGHPQGDVLPRRQGDAVASPAALLGRARLSTPAAASWRATP